MKNNCVVRVRNRLSFLHMGGKIVYVNGKRIGPKIEPCGAPDTTVCGSDSVPSNGTDCLQSVR